MKVKIFPIVIVSLGLIIAGKTFDLVGTGIAESTAAVPKKKVQVVKAAKKVPVEKEATKEITAADVLARKESTVADLAVEKDLANTDVAKAVAPTAVAAANDELEPASSAKSEKKVEIVDDKKDGGHGEKSEGGHGAKEENVLPANVSYDRPAEQIPQFTDTEKEVLEKLAGRRAELEAWAKDLEMKESLLDASSKKLDEKLAELKQLKADTEVLLKTYNDNEDVKIKSLVKIYENMKPKDAAPIFEQMEKEVLLEIVDKMSERKVSPILAAMNPKKAKELTEELARQRSLTPPSVKQANAAPAAQ